MIKVFDNDRLVRLPSLSLENVESYYLEMRNKGFGIYMDRDGDVCISKEDPNDDGLSYAEQLKELQNLKKN